LFPKSVSGTSGKSRENKGDDMTKNSDESDEDRHQRHRRERMLDAVTLICVRDGIERMNRESTTEKTWGRMSRDTAENICDAINEYDAEH
jgi:hypothetical protein